MSTCETCAAYPHMVCAGCGWHVLPFHDSGLCSSCRAKDSA